MRTGPALTLALPVALLVGCDGAGRPNVSVDQGSATVPPPPATDAPRPTRCEDAVLKQDFDRDGFSPSTGDCDDCDFERGPGALDVPNDGIDQDCRGGDATAPPAACDVDVDADGDEDGIPIEDAARALGLCGAARDRPGLVDARWLRLDGSERPADPRQLWLPARFGANVLPREGGRMLLLSTGIARDAEHDEATPGCDWFGGPRDAAGSWPGGVAMPPGFPRGASVCEDARGSSAREPTIDGGARAYDDVGLELTLRAPTNATALAFDSILFSAAYPDFLCSAASDGFVALLEDAPARFDGENVLIDANEDPVGADSVLLTRCEGSRRGARSVECSDATILLGTGFAREESTCAPRALGDRDLGGASTGWLRTVVRIEAGATFTLRFHLWDAGDPLLDTTVALDNLRFLTIAVDDDAPATAHSE